ncbi:MAG: multicopper oxidase domain-containing protein, partial [Microbacteriaceae bacterium]
MTHAFTRRHVLAIGFAATVTAAGGLFAFTSCTTPTAPARPFGPIELRQPPLIRAKDGTLTAALKPVWASTDIGVGRAIESYNYNGAIPGATWVANPGDRLKITLQNRMPSVTAGGSTPAAHHDHGTDLTRPHVWTNTNLHTHGLHVSPSGNQDNVFISIAPGETFDYDIHVPKDHEAGFFWYHPHRHGAVTQQVRGGMAGALIIRGDIDAVPEIAAAKEKVMVVQAIELGSEFKEEAPIPDPSKSEAFFPRTQIFWTVNGSYKPMITMYPGEVQRWRILNAAEGKLASLHMAGHSLNQIAWDGLSLAAPEPALDTMLSPGNRVDVLVKAGAAGSYDLVLSPGSSQKPFVPGMPQTIQPPGKNGTVSPELVPRVVATVIVKGTGPEMALPTTLPAYNPEMLPVVRTRDVRYTVQRLPDHSFVSFGINGRAFNPDDPPYTMKRGTAEEWTIINGADEGF